MAFRLATSSTAVHADPFPFYKTLRAEHPCFWSEEANMWVLSRYEDISRALQDWRTYSSAQGNLMDELPNRAGATLGTTDPPRHDRLRSLIQMAVTKRALEHIIAPVGDTAKRHLDELEGIYVRRVATGNAHPRVTDKVKLAMTVGVEHFTATFGENVLEGRLLRGVDGAIGDLWRWHCMEELEHKSVAFDVFEAVDGRYWVRVAGLGLATGQTRASTARERPQ